MSPRRKVQKRPPLRSAVARSAAQVEGLSKRGQAARARALETVSLMRREGLSLTAASAQVETSPGTVRKYAGADALERIRTGRYVARGADRLSRKIKVITTKGVKEVTIRGSRAASLAGQHASAVGYFLAKGHSVNLSRLAGKRVGRWTLQTDLDALEAMARSGELDIDDIYKLSA